MSNQNDQTEVRDRILWIVDILSGLERGVALTVSRVTDPAQLVELNRAKDYALECRAIIDALDRYVQKPKGESR